MTMEGWLNKLAGHNTGRKQPRTNARATVSCSNNSAMGIGDGFTKSGVAYTTYRMGTTGRRNTTSYVATNKEAEGKAERTQSCLQHLLSGAHSARLAHGKQGPVDCPVTNHRNAEQHLLLKQGQRDRLQCTTAADRTSACPTHRDEDKNKTRNASPC